MYGICVGLVGLGFDEFVVCIHDKWVKADLGLLKEEEDWGN